MPEAARVKAYWSALEPVFPSESAMPENPADLARLFKTMTIEIDRRGYELARHILGLQITAELPDVSSHAGEFLFTDGTDVLWAPIREVPVAGDAGQHLEADGSGGYAWADPPEGLPDYSGAAEGDHLEISGGAPVWAVPPAGGGGGGRSLEAVTDAEPLAPGAGPTYEVTISGDRTIGAPSSQTAGQIYIWIIHQDATGGHSITWDPAYLFPDGADPGLATASEATTVYTFVSDGTVLSMYAQRKNIGKPFSPDDLASLAVWLEADAITGLANNDPVPQWDDDSGNLRHFTQGTAGAQPLFKEAVLNGLPVVQFDNSNDALLNSWVPSSPATIFLVYRQNGVDDNRRAIQTQSGNDFLIGPYSGTHRYYNGAFITGPSVVAGTWVIAEVKQDSSGAELFVDGVSQGTNTGSVSWAGLALGGGEGSFVEPLDGEIYSLLWYSALLSDADRNSVRDYLKSKTGL